MKRKVITMNKNVRKTLFVIALQCSLGLVGSLATASDQIPGAPQKKPIVLRNATLHTVSGDVIENGSVLFEAGKIKAVGVNIPFPGDSEIVESKGQHIYPGLMDSFSSLGLVEIDSVRASIDTTETGNINPNVRAAVAFNPDSEAIPVARANGILTTVITPSGGLVAGRSAVMMLDGWTWESMTLKPDAGMVFTWPRYTKARMRRGPEEPEAAADADKLAELHELFHETHAYFKAKNAEGSQQPVDLRLEAMKPVLDGKIPVLVMANSLKQIQTAVAFAKQYELKMILVGAADAGHCLPLLKEAGIPVVVSSTYRLPARHDASYDEAYALPSVLQKAEIRFCIAGDGRFGASMVRNLPYHAASAAAFGLTEPQALRAITLSPAEIFGVSDHVGSLEVGKDATLFVADGNILETPTHVSKAYIQGRAVDLSSKHTQLNEKYQAKYKQ